MKIEKIIFSKIKDRVFIFFSSKDYLPLYIDDFVTLKLKTNTLLTPLLFRILSRRSLFYLLYQYSLRQIAMSPKIKEILLPKIRQKLYIFQRKYTYSPKINTQKIISRVLKKLNSLDLLNRDIYAQYLVKHNQHKSSYFLRQLFSRYHLDNIFLPDRSSDTKLLKKHLYKKLTNISKPLDVKTKNKIIRSLIQKGFAYPDIKIQIDEWSIQS